MTSNKPVILITGATGLLGRAVSNAFNNSDWNVVRTGFSRASKSVTLVDLRKKDSVESLVINIKPDIIVHCAVERRPDVVEKNPLEARKINIDSVRWLCDSARTIGAWMLYISTDYVFDGESPPFPENSPTNPLNEYGLCKFEGEQEVLVDKNNAVLRIPILYGPVETIEESAVYCMLVGILNSSRDLQVSAYERRYPTHVSDVALACRQLADRKMMEQMSKKTDTEVSGIFHWSSDEQMTRYDMCIAMADALDLPKNHIKPLNEPQPGAKRPFDARMTCQRLKNLGIGHATKFTDSIKDELKTFL